MSQSYSSDIATGLTPHSNWYNDVNASLPKRVHLLDTTLREGEQSPGISFTTRQRLQIAWMLDYFGVDCIEISPIISPEHEESCKTMMEAGLSATIVAHVRTLAKDIDVARRCGADWIAMYHSVSDVHLQHKLRVSREVAVQRSIDAVEYAKSYGLKLRFTMEDASRADPDFLKSVCTLVSKAGADRISLPDTLGVLRPMGMYNLVQTVRKVIDTPIDLHCHNDIGLALANALAGVEAGADQIHTSINGLGERVGIPSLAEVAIALKLLYKEDMKLRLEMLHDLSELVSGYTGVVTSPSEPIVGENAYKHKAGTHVAAIIRSPTAYEIIPPKSVGNRRRIVFGELSGKNGAAHLLSILGMKLGETEAMQMAQGLKSLHLGDLFELELSETLESAALQSDEEGQQE
ncbi:MAG: 2-isopropylmalate synthase [Thaumarchaeota archaeon]|mgnify:CR=1 FL=1|nr:2-isopropylmalate synthase [Nitrososphaerota archaeon]